MPLRRPLLITLLMSGSALLLAVAAHHEPLEGWLFFVYARAIGLALLFGVSCLMAGHEVLRRVLHRTLPFAEHFSLAMALGVLAFFLLSVGFGLLGLLGRPFFFGAPVLLMLAGYRGSSRFVIRAARRCRATVASPRLTPLTALVLAGALLGFLIVWVPTLLPQNACADARWYHLPIAERYVAEGRIAPYVEGWVLGAYPQLASMIYAWAYSAPGELFDQLVLAAQLEVVLFVATLVGISACTRKLLGARSPLAYCTLFLFPGIYCYDSGLVLGGDHVAALFAPAILSSALGYVRAPGKDWAILLGAGIAGALDTKYSAVIVLPLPLLLVAARLRTSAGRAAAVWLVGVVVSLTSPHWLKNWLYYGDPLFPLLREWLPARPWASFIDAPFHATNWRARPAALGPGLADMLRTLVTFSFEPHEYEAFHGKLPVFGSLFTLCTPLLALLPRRRALGLTFLGVYLGIAGWFWLHAFDRYLQVLLPWMAAGTAGVLQLLWREGGGARVATSALVGVQIVWGASVPFLPTHRGVAGSILNAVSSFIGAPRRTPLVAFPEWQALGAALPRGARVLIHEEAIHAGLRASSVVDSPGDQGALYWGEPGATTAGEMWHTLRELGVTHIIYAERTDHGADTLAGGLAFFDFVAHHTRRITVQTGFVLAELGASAPPEEPVPEVAYLGCGDSRFASGIYPIHALSRFANDQRAISPPRLRLEPTSPLGSEIRYLAYDATCHGPLPAAQRRQFELLAARGTTMLLARKAAVDSARAEPRP